MRHSSRLLCRDPASENAARCSCTGPLGFKEEKATITADTMSSMHPNGEDDDDREVCIALHMASLRGAEPSMQTMVDVGDKDWLRRVLHRCSAMSCTWCRKKALCSGVMIIPVRFASCVIGMVTTKPYESPMAIILSAYLCGSRSWSQSTSSGSKQDFGKSPGVAAARRSGRWLRGVALRSG